MSANHGNTTLLPAIPAVGRRFVPKSGDASAASRLRNRFPYGFATILGQGLKTIYDPPQRLNPSLSSVDESILARVATGEAGAMNRCIDRYGAMVWTIVRRHLGDSPEAEDLVQEIFTEIWKKAGSFDPAVASESTYVGLIARRRSIDQLRRRERQPGFETLDAADSIEMPASVSQSAAVDAEMLRRSVATLPEDTRHLFQLFFEDGFTHPEIAERTGLPLGTVKTRLRRGLVALRDRLLRKDHAKPQSAS
jgi:RNA polymerase sigma factor (sigma-70 family)